MKQILFLFFVAFSFSTQAQLDVSFQTPHPDILSLADVTLPPATRTNSDKTMSFFLYRDQYKTLAELSEKEFRLGGLRINPITNTGSRTRYYNKVELYDFTKKKSMEISGLPSPLKLANLSWSPDEQRAVFTNTTETGLELWMIDMKTTKAKRLTEGNVNGNIGSTFMWLKDSKSLLVTMLPTDRPQIIEKSNSIPSGPTISANEGSKAQNRTYQDLLSDNIDEQNFETLATSTIYKVDLDGKATKWLNKGMYTDMDVSPDGKYILVEEMKKPFSYIVTYSRFPSTSTVYTIKGDKVALVNESPLEEERPQGFMSTSAGKRSMNWRNDKPATLYYVVALDGGDANIEVPFRDQVYTLSAPFTGEGKEFVKTIDRYAGITWGNEEFAILYDRWWNTRNSRTYLFDPGSTKEPVVIQSRNYQDAYSDIGNFETKKNEFGEYVLLLNDDTKAYLVATGYSENGILPFIDEIEFPSLTKTRLWQAEKGEQLESISDIVDMKSGKILQRIESPTEFPNYYFRNIKTNKLEQLTFFKNPFDAISNIHKEVITYKRDDGLELSATLYLPPNYDKNSGEKLPMLMWAYPREYKDKNSAAQITSSPNEFTSIYYGSPIYWVNRGYAVLDDAAFPIIGVGDEQPNDTFIEQLVANGKAGIDAVDKLGYIDRDRVAVGGHSYGAFMTANLLTHSDLFAAGIARSGAYNRSLTPFGFQAEERNFWEGADVYYKMSPFMNADKMKHPLLLIHGAEDNNSGTYPMQSERYFNALKGLGATARLVMLPKESHGYSAKENIMHMLWEQDQWLEKYVKNKGN